MKFSEMGLHPSVMAGVEANQFVECTPIQEVAIPQILAGRDLAGLAQTGTGKTAAFVLPLIDRIVRARETQDWRRSHFVLVLVPTRELAEQVYENVMKLGQKADVQATAIYGGTGYEGQKAALKKGIDFVVATPGRLIDLYKEHLLDLAQVRAIVFDEADRMFDMGFKDDMKFILRRVPQDRQFLVFSATLNFDVLNTAYEFGANPVEVNVSRDQAKAENVVDEIFHVGSGEKPRFLLSILQKYKPKQAIIFSNFKHNVDRIAKFLSANGVPAMGISSLISQSQRTRIMELFRAENNDRNILVATDVAARGLDIKGVDMVINFELPDDAENYVHRIGRTGRAGASGHAFSFVSDRDVEALQRIEGYLGHKVSIGWIDDTDLIKDFKEFPQEDRRQDFKRRDQRSDRSGHEHSRGDRPHRPRGSSSNRPRSQHQGSSSHQGSSQHQGQGSSAPHHGASSHQGGARAHESGSRQGHESRTRAAHEAGGRHQGHHQGNGSARPHDRSSHYASGSAKTGGHRGHQQKHPSHKSHSKSSHHRHPQSQNKSAHGSQPSRHGYKHKPSSSSQSGTVAAAKPGVAASISSFFKKLFGGA